MATYFGTTPKNDWNPNGSAESGHNFIERINNQNAEIADKSQQYQDYAKQVDTAREGYNQAYQNQQNYNDLWNQAKQSEDVQAAREQYQKSANAVNATNTAMTNLPSQINAGSNVVLNASQRNAALGNQMNKYANTLGYWTNQNATDQNMYQTALGIAENLAGRNMAQEQAKVNQAMQDYQTQLGQYNTLYDQKLSAQSLLQNIYNQMLQDEAQHWQEVYDPWAANLSAETSRYAQEQENYRARLAKQMSEYEKYLQKENEEAKKNRANSANGQLTDSINKYYADYQSTLDDLDRETGDFMSYLLGKNSLFGGGLTNKTADQAKALRAGGFNDYLASKNPNLYNTVLNGNYNDLAGYYNLARKSTSSNGAW